MKIFTHRPIGNINQITDNTNELNSDCAFLLTPLNVKYMNDTSGISTLIKADELRNYFDFSKIKIVGITGTNGKTTTAAAIYSMLLDLGYKVALQGTRGLFVNEQKIKGKGLTTPMQLENFANIDLAQKEGCEFFIMEVSSHAIAQKRIEGLDFALKIFTNLTQDHLDFHKTFEDYKNTKLSFLKGNVLLNADDESVSLLSGIKYGIENGADFKVNAFSEKDGLWFAMEYMGEQASFSSDMAGRFNIYNLCCAVAAVKLLTNAPLEKISEAMQNFGGVEGRMQVISGEPLVIVDFAHTPDGIAQVLDSMYGKNLTVVFGAGGDRDALKRPLMGKEVALRAKKIVVTSDNPRSEDADKIISQILDGIIDFKGELIVERDRKKAIEIAVKNADLDDAILILGKGDETTQTIGSEIFEFDDRKVALEILSSLVSTR